MSVLCKTEQAREFISTMHPDGLEIPRNVNLRYISNHFQAAVVYAAMGEIGQLHNIGRLYVGYKALWPDLLDVELKTPTERIRDRATKTFSAWEREARRRVHDGFSKSILDGIAFEAANQFRFDEEPVDIFAVNRLGETAIVAGMGGFMKPDDRNWHFIEEMIDRGLNKEFPVSN